MYRGYLGSDPDRFEDVEVQTIKEIEQRLQDLDHKVRITQAFKPSTRGGNVWPLFKGAIEKKDWLSADRIADDISEVMQASVLAGDVKADLWKLIRLVRDRAKKIKVSYDLEDPSDDENRDTEETDAPRKEQSLASSAERTLKWFADAVNTMCDEIKDGQFYKDDSFLSEPDEQKTSASILLRKLREIAKQTIHERDTIERELVLWFRLCATRLEEVIKEGHVAGREALEMPDTPAVSIPQTRMQNLERVRSTLTGVLCKVDSIRTQRDAFPNRVDPTQEQYAHFVVQQEKKTTELQRQVRDLREENNKYQRQVDVLQRRVQESPGGLSQRGPVMADGSGSSLTKTNLRILELEQHVEELQKQLQQERQKNQTMAPDDRQKEFSALAGSYGEKISTLKDDLASIATDHRKVERLVTTSKNTIKLLAAGETEEDSTSSRPRDTAAEMRIQDLEILVEDLRYRLQTNTASLARAEEEKEHLKTRLSKLMGSKIQTNNTELADLSDEIRPIKIGEWYQELYDNQWTDAFQSLVEAHKLDEILAIERLREILQESYAFCQREADAQLRNIVAAMLIDSGLTRPSEETLPKPEIMDQMKMMLKDTRRQISTRCIQKKYIDQQKTISASESEFSSCLPYVRRCLELCWYMTIQSPPLWLDPECPHRINADVFRFYTKKGTLLDFVVWPALYLTKGGKLLCKGVAQPM